MALIMADCKDVDGVSFKRNGRPNASRITKKMLDKAVELKKRTRGLKNCHSMISVALKLVMNEYRSVTLSSVNVMVSSG